MRRFAVRVRGSCGKRGGVEGFAVGRETGRGEEMGDGKEGGIGSNRNMTGSAGMLQTSSVPVLTRSRIYAADRQAGNHRGVTPGTSEGMGCDSSGACALLLGVLIPERVVCWGGQKPNNCRRKKAVESCGCRLCACQVMLALGPREGRGRRALRWGCYGVLYSRTPV